MPRQGSGRERRGAVTDRLPDAAVTGDGGSASTDNALEDEAASEATLEAVAIGADWTAAELERQRALLKRSFSELLLGLVPPQPYHKPAAWSEHGRHMVKLAALSDPVKVRLRLVCVVQVTMLVSGCL